MDMGQLFSKAGGKAKTGREYIWALVIGSMIEERVVGGIVLTAQR
jgi:hypothetical protein